MSAVTKYRERATVEVDTGIKRIHSHNHAVQFYGDDAELLKTVGTFLSEGLVAGEPAIVIATPGHRIAIEKALESHLIDVAAAKRLGDLVMLDAEEMLATFIVDQAPVGALHAHEDKVVPFVPAVKTA